MKLMLMHMHLPIYLRQKLYLIPQTLNLSQRLSLSTIPEPGKTGNLRKKQLSMITTQEIELSDKFSNLVRKLLRIN
jgi:hypothetical protein